MSQWKRPSDVPYPQRYLKINGKIRDGKCRSYWVQDLTEEYFEEVLHYLVTGFFADEPLSKCLDAKNDPGATKEMGDIWLNALKMKLSLICLTKNDEGKTKIAGFNVLCPNEKDSPSSAVENEKCNKIFSILTYFEKTKNPYEEFKCDVYLSAIGLYVLPEFRGEGLGQAILAAREIIGKSLGFKISLTVFTTPASQKPAERVGFKDYVTLNYLDLAKIDKVMEIPGVEKYTVFGKYMYMKYE